MGPSVLRWGELLANANAVLYEPPVPPLGYSAQRPSKIASEAYSENAEEEEKKQRVPVHMPDSHLPNWL